jgi:competence protein ComEA
VAALAGVAVAAWLLRPAPTPLEEALPVARTEAAAPQGSGGDGEAAATEGEGAVAEGGAAPDGAPSSGSVPTEVVAHAAGAVVRPGVYRLPPGARVDDLVLAAGGLAPDADPARLNLAAPLADGDRVYVPRRGEADLPAVALPEGPAGGGGAGDGGPGGGPGSDGEGAPVDINTADEAELDELPGVGPSIAAAIVAHREEHGPFRSVDDLLDVRGIGEAKLAEIRPRATV